MGGNKLVLIYEQYFSPDIKIIANNEKDLLEHLFEKYSFSEMKIDSDNYLSYKDSYGNRELIKLEWVKEI